MRAKCSRAKSSPPSPPRNKQKALLAIWSERLRWPRAMGGLGSTVSSVWQIEIPVGGTCFCASHFVPEAQPCRAPVWSKQTNKSIVFHCSDSKWDAQKPKHYPHLILAHHIL